MLLVPADKLRPATARTAVPELITELPNTVRPATNDTYPVGATLPAAALTIAVRTVEEFCANRDGLAVTTVLVATRGCTAVRATGVEVEDAKALLRNNISIN